mmetsp:Transcript_64522/g.172819  ORF Transcript_64522/g.172819 Transcript_64522/m.172819 type:complete len:213 (+) Transcript_64522:143-781(+)
MSKMQDYLGSLQKLLQQSNALELQLEHVFDKVDDVLLSIDSEDIKAKIESKILKGADQRDPDKIYDFFDTVYSCSNPDDTWIPQFCDRFGVHPAEARDWIQQLDCRDDGALDRAGFARIAAFQSSTARWASTLPLAEILGDALGALVPDPPDYLEQLASLDHGVVHSPSTASPRPSAGSSPRGSTSYARAWRAPGAGATTQRAGSSRCASTR